MKQKTSGKVQGSSVLNGFIKKGGFIREEVWT